jgi:hypothetical protein
MKRNGERSGDLQVASDRGLRQLVVDLELVEEFDAGVLGCEFCEEVVTVETTFAIFPEDGLTRFVCSRPPCVKRFALHVQRSGLR